MGKNLLLALGMTAAVFMANGSAFAAGDAAKGEKVFKKCKACHTVKMGKHKVGPSLAGVVGRKAGSAEGFKKYRGLKATDWSWDEKTLDEWLKNPKTFAKKRNRKSGMVFKLKKAADRENVIAYLKTK
jgi:cytochrome c